MQNTAGVNSKFLDPHLTEEENLDYLSGTVNMTQGAVYGSVYRVSC